MIGILRLEQYFRIMSGEFVGTCLEYASEAGKACTLSLIPYQRLESIPPNAKKTKNEKPKGKKTKEKRMKEKNPFAAKLRKQE